jgi:hypothetical protein
MADERELEANYLVGGRAPRRQAAEFQRRTHQRREERWSLSTLPISLMSSMAGAEQLDLRAAELDEREKALARREAELARRERLAAERDRIADERDRLANHREHMAAR